MIQQGQVIHNTYEIRQQIGQGGAGQVFLAWHLNLQKFVVIKKIKSNYVGVINGRQEADILKRLHHRHIPQVYDFIQENGNVYTVIDYIDGCTMQDYIDRQVRFDENQIIIWMRQMLDALDYIHSRQPPIIHNDIKPANIMIDKSGDLCLIDFNISFGDDESEVMGFSAGFASPEQILRIQRYSSGGNYREIILDARSDIFSMAASFYTLMTGESLLPIFQNNLPLWRQNQIYSEPLCRVIARALSRNPEERPQSAKEMTADLDRLKLFDAEYLKKRGQKRLLAGGIAAAAAAVIIGGGLAFYNSKSSALSDTVADVRELSADGSYEEAADLAVDTLNDGGYTIVLNRNPQEKAELFYWIGNRYFVQEDYDTAASWYRQAADLDYEESALYRDYAIALARQSKLSAAEQVLEQGAKYGIGDAEVCLTNAEIACAGEKYEDTIGYCEDALVRTDDGEIAMRAYALEADAYQNLHNSETAISVLREGTQELSGDYRATLLRRLGNLYIEVINTQGNSVAGSYVDAAVSIYEELTSGTTVLFDDSMNLAILKGMQGNYTDAEEILTGMLQAYPEDYRVPMRYSLLEFSRQSASDGQSTADYTEARNYYERAEQLYAAVKADGKSDGNMEYLESLMQELG